MDYDDIDKYVDQLFRQDQPKGSQSVESTSGDWRIDRIDQIIEDAYNDAIWWHNQRISAGCDPRSGLRGLPYIPWDENIDGAAAMQGNGAGEQMQHRQVGKNWTEAEYAAYLRKISAGFDPYANLRSNAQLREQDGGWGCAIAILCVVLVVLFIWMLTV